MSDSTDINSLLNKARKENIDGQTESFSENIPEASDANPSDIEGDGIVSDESKTTASVEGGEVATSSGKTSNILETIKGKYLQQFKQRPKMTIGLTIFSILFLMTVLTDGESDEKQNDSLAQQSLNKDGMIVNEESFSEFAEPDVSFEEAFEIPTEVSEMQSSDRELGVSDNLTDLVDLVDPPKLDTEIVDKLKEETDEKISLIEIQSIENFRSIKSHIEYSVSEMEQMRNTINILKNTISNLSADVAAKKYDLGYEKDRPQIKLVATVPVLENCTECVAHAGFYHDGIKYQIGNGSKWHDFDVEISGNRMTLIKNDYVYDYWVGQ